MYDRKARAFAQIAALVSIQCYIQLVAPDVLPPWAAALFGVLVCAWYAIVALGRR
mgnify:CR=1 FL=1|jgi:hypothetical protein